jgi:hypothetical protein
MSRKLGVITLVVVSALTPNHSALSQCNNQITLVPLHAMSAASHARDFTRYRYSLTASDSLLIRSHEDSETAIGPYDTGFAIVREGKTIQSITLRKLREFQHEEIEYSESFTSLAVTRACTSGGPIYFVSMQYMGDLTSPALLFSIVPSAEGYDVSSLPMISGGILDVSRSSPLHIQTWDNLHEDNCEACYTPYEVTEYEIREGKPVQTRQRRTQQFYKSGDFDDRRRIRFIP